MKVQTYKEFRIPTKKVLQALRRVGYEIPENVALAAEVTLNQKRTRVGAGDFNSIVLFWEDYTEIGGPLENEKM